jgi:hypothetical protein
MMGGREHVRWAAAWVVAVAEVAGCLQSDVEVGRWVGP